MNIITLHAISLLTILDRYDKIEILETSVLTVMQRGEYASALDHLRNFVLEDAAMFKLLPQLIDNAGTRLAPVE